MNKSNEKISGREPTIGVRSPGNAPALGGVVGAIRQLQDGDLTVRLAAAEKLAGYREKGVGGLGQVLLDRQSDPDVHLLAIQVLERIGTARAHQAIGLAVRSPRYSVSLTAQAVLARLGKKPSRLRSLAARLTGQAAPTWSDLEQRLQQVLSQQTQPDGVPLESTIREFLRMNVEGAERLMAATANTTHALPTVHGLARIAIEPTPRRELAMSLLARFLNHVDRKVVKLAAKSLATVGTPAVDLLVEALPHASAAGRAQIVAALGELKLKRAQMALVQSLRDDEPKVRQAAALALASRGGRLPVDIQAEIALFRKDWPALAQLKAAALPVLQQALAVGEPDPVAVITVLGLIADNRAIPVLREHLRTGSDHVRVAAAGALGQIGHSSTIPALQEACHDPHRLVRYAAEQALAGLVGCA